MALEVATRNPHSTSAPTESSILHVASKSGQSSMIQWAVDGGHAGNVGALDAQGPTPLYFAHLKKHHDCFDRLISYGANINKSLRKE